MKNNKIYTFLSTKGIIKHFIYLYLSSIISFTIFRVLFYFDNFSKMSADYDSIFSVTIKAFLRGLQFDSAMLGYIFLAYIPILLLLNIINTKYKIIYNIFFYIVIIVISILIFGSASDIILYSEYGRKLDASWFGWFNDDPAGTIGLVFTGFNMWWTVIPYITIVYFYIKFNKKKFTENILDRRGGEKRIFIHIIYGLLFLILGGFIGDTMMKGRIMLHEGKYKLWYMYPYLTYIDAKSEELNNVALNPAFSFLTDLQKDNYIDLIEEGKAVKNTNYFLNTNIEERFFIKNYTYNNISKKKNIVLIIMESIGIQKLSHYGNKEKLTPFLDSLIKESLFFENGYSYSTQTSQAVHSIMTGLLSPNNLQGTKNTEGFSYYKKASIISELKKYNYKTSFFIPHSEKFDNMGNYSKGIEIDNTYYSEKDYPKDEQKLFSQGVTDEYLYKFGIKEISEKYNSKTPFFSTFLTISNHEPYHIPEKFRNKHSKKLKDKGLQDKTIFYTDQSLKLFFKNASKEKWFDNTLFVLVGDHGSHGVRGYDKNRVPIIFYSKDIKPKISNKLISQIDILPSVMGYLGLDFKNRNFGKDIFSEEKKYILLDNIKKYMVLKDSTLLSENYNKTGLKITNINNKEKIEITPENKPKIDSMKLYGYSLIQSAQKIYINKK